MTKKENHNRIRSNAAKIINQSCRELTIEKDKLLRAHEFKAMLKRNCVSFLRLKRKLKIFVRCESVDLRVNLFSKNSKLKKKMARVFA